MMGFMGMNMANSAGSTMMGAVGQTSNNSEPKEERIMPEPGSLFAKKEEPVVATPTEEKTPAEGLKFCPNCGTPTSGGNFCGHCGNKLK